MSESQSEVPPANMETLISSISSAAPNTTIKGSPIIIGDYASVTGESGNEQGTTE
jgi:hypothetical protein